MTLPDGYTVVPPGKIAAVVTYLEMREPPALPAPTHLAGAVVEQIANPDPAWYRALFRRVGEDWLWFSRLGLSDEDLTAIINDPLVDVFALRHHGADKGLLELDRRAHPDIELQFLGVTRDLIGTGAGHVLMDAAIREAWRHRPRRFFLHTCTLDHPRAIGFYMKRGFVPYARAIEIADDPRLTGAAPPESAPHIPLIRPIATP